MSVVTSLEWAVMWFARMSLPTLGWEEKTVVCRFNLPMSKRIDTRDITLIYYLAERQVNFFMFAVFFNLSPLL